MERKLFDVGRYVHDNGTINRNAFANDLGALAREASTNRPYYERVHFFSLTKLSSDWIIDARLGDKHIGAYYSDETDLDRREKLTGLEMAKSLVDKPIGTLCVHISPPGGPLNYEEGRIQVGLNRSAMGITFTESYGIPTPFDQKTHEYFGYRLTEVSDGYAPRTTEELRDRVFEIEVPDDVNPWDYLGQLIPLDKVWDNIKSGQVINDTYTMKKQAETIADETLKKLPKNATHLDLIEIGAFAERRMAEKGYRIASGNCGTSNSDLLNNIFAVGGSKMMVVEGRRILCCTCPFCKEKVEAPIHSGKIHCPKCKKTAPWTS